MQGVAGATSASPITSEKQQLLAIIITLFKLDISHPQQGGTLCFYWQVTRNDWPPLHPQMGEGVGCPTAISQVIEWGGGRMQADSPAAGADPCVDFTTPTMDGACLASDWADPKGEGGGEMGPGSPGPWGSSYSTKWH